MDLQPPETTPGLTLGETHAWVLRRETAEEAGPKACSPGHPREAFSGYPILDLLGPLPLTSGVGVGQRSDPLQLSSGLESPLTVGLYL